MHPDHALIDTARAALDWWEQLGGGPSSSITGRGAISYLEDKFSELLDHRYCLALPSGTTALHTALTTVGVRPGDQVICAAYDWPTASSVVTAAGAIPVYASIDPNTLTIDPTQVHRYLTRRTAAIIATHLLGVPADIPALRAATNDRIPIIEDAAQALGSRLDERLAGTLGDATAFSLGPGKALDAGEGGIAVFTNHDDYTTAVAATQHPTRQLLTGLVPAPAPHSARMPPLTAVLAAHQLAQLTPRLDHLRAAWRRAAEVYYQPVVGADLRRDPVGPTLTVLDPAAPPSDGLGAIWLSPEPPPDWLQHAHLHGVRHPDGRADGDAVEAR